MVKAVILVGIGGGLGSILRFLSGFVVNKCLPTVFPWGTFLVNLRVLKLKSGKTKNAPFKRYLNGAIKINKQPVS